MNGDYVTVLQTVDLGVIAIAKSLLDNADIDYVTQNENFGSIYNGFYSITGLIKVQVLKDDAEVAAQLLADLQNNNNAPLDANDK